MRAFISINIPCEAPIAKFCDDLKELGVRTVDRDQLHITLKFLGEIKETDVPQITAVMKNVASEFRGFNLHLNEAGVFSRRDGSGIVWLGANDPQPALIAQRLDAQLLKLGMPQETKAFKCHITVARPKYGIKQIEKQLIAQTHDFGEYAVASFCLMSSILRPSGPTYKVESEVHLDEC
ncbi:RNA 2',3'-cyclic phosphodiesterase [Candidatus Methanomassiliicoccus intestinalis]|uniref:RNA 2',3'-cyclic phosphodiesterase n=1 Tax=Candidatus Methanomassiliicoccus intestinalis TaxID=1406512 RepID=UPI0037DDDC4F